MSFDKRVTTTKRNHIYFGPTESNKIAVTLEEVSVDLDNIFDQINNHSDAIVALASGYLDPDGSIAAMRSYVSEVEKEVDMSIYIRATQDETF